MPRDELSYKSFCWALGTTSFRAKNFNLRIELQLELLAEFRSKPEFRNETWAGNDALQTSYYLFLQSRDFVEGDAGRKAKDAREKTSGLVDIGLITDERRLTGAGAALLGISREGDFTPDNELGVPRDSFLYLRQLLKTTNPVDGGWVRPFVTLLYLLSKAGTLSMEEFTYLLPLCVDEATTTAMPAKVAAIRRGALRVDDVILQTLMGMSNYRQALDLLLENDVDEDLICAIGMNRKSRAYDKPYYPLYLALKRVFLERNEDAIPALLSAIEDTKRKKEWRRLLFAEKTRGDPEERLNETSFSSVRDEAELKIRFFEALHLFKAKATLGDYCDLNRRYLKSADVILFENDTVKLDTIPRQFFRSVIDELYLDAFSPSPLLEENCPLADIAPCLVIDEQAIIQGVSADLGLSLFTLAAARDAVEAERYDRLHTLIDTRFTDHVLLYLLDLFEARKDDEINALVTDNADIPTIFEYILGIIWYKVSQRKGKLLEYMKLSLDADLLPKTHAGGGEADIVYEYEATADYPAHSLLLEATLANATSQRKMEMEPVSRHMGQHLLRTGNPDSHCIFVSTKLNINVISDFHCRRQMPWFDTSDYSHYVPGMKITPIETTELKDLLRKGMKYPAVYRLCADAHGSDLLAPAWYETCIKAPIAAF